MESKLKPEDSKYLHGLDKSVKLGAVRTIGRQKGKV